ncbi:hypothetical protein SLE2022_199290 [Rubroshorea leprosula]
MDPFSNLKKSFKSHGSYKNIRTGRSNRQTGHEELPILSDQDSLRAAMAPANPGDPRSPKIDRGVSNVEEIDPTSSIPTPTPRVWKKSSYEFWKDREHGSDQSFDSTQGGRPQPMDDSPILNKQKNNSNNEIALDMDLEKDELKQNQFGDSKPPLEPPLSNPSQWNESFRRRYKDSPMEEPQSRPSDYQQQNNNEVLRCSSNASFQRAADLLARMKTKSRLIDPQPEEVEFFKSGLMGKSEQTMMRSGLLGNKAVDDDEDDPFADEDLPEKYRKANFNCLTLLQWVSLVLLIAALLCSLLIQPLKQIVLWKLILWKWLVLILVLICGRLVSGWGIRLIVFFIERNFLLRKKVLYFVYGVRRAVQNCLWLGYVLLAWHFLFDKKVERESKSAFLKYITKVLICLLVGTLLWLVKTLIVKVLASSFHVSTYFDRIQETLFNQYVIETLSGPPVIEIQQLEEEEARTELEILKLQNAGITVPPDLRATASPPPSCGTKKVYQKSSTFISKSGMLSRGGSKKDEKGISIENLHKLTHKNISAWNMKRLMNIVRHGSLSTLDEQILHGEHVREDDSSKQITNEREAKAAARKIFQNVARRGSQYIFLEDLFRFMRDDEALKTMTLFEGARENKRISKKALKDWAVNAFRERRALALTLNDTKTAVNKLHHMVNIIAATIIGVIWLIILEIATSKFLLFVSSQLVLVAFVFGNTCKTIFEAIVFLFIIHPFDVGDRCEIDGVQMVVEEMNILTTIFLRYDNLKVIYPNSVLSTKPIMNFYRSPDMGDAVEFCVHIATPAETISLIKKRITSYIENKKEHWYPSPLIVAKDLDGLNMLRMAVWPCHRMNHQNMGERFSRRSLLVEEMAKILRETDMQYRMHPFDIKVVSIPPITSTRNPFTRPPETSAEHQ